MIPFKSVSSVVDVEHQIVEPRYSCGTYGAKVDVSSHGVRRAVYDMQTAADKHATKHGCGIATDKIVKGIVQRIGVII